MFCRFLQKFTSMVKLDAFEIQLDSPSGCYFAGQTINGELVASLQFSLRLKEISVTLKGEAKTNWVNKVSDNIYDSLEPYVNEKKILRYLQDTSDGETLQPGSHRMPFQFQLPPQLPSSYEGEYGYVRYSLVAQAELGPDPSCIMPASKGKEIGVERPVTVLASVELRQLSRPASEQAPITKEESFEIVGCCGSRGHVTASVSIPTTAVIAGDLFPVQIRLDNQSRRRQPAAVLNFVQDVHFRSVSFFQSASDSKMITRIIDSMRVDCPEHGKNIVKDITLRVPRELPATSLGNTIIMVRYKVRLEIGTQCEVVIPVGVASKP